MIETSEAERTMVESKLAISRTPDFDPRIASERPARSAATNQSFPAFGIGAGSEIRGCVFLLAKRRRRRPIRGGRLRIIAGAHRGRRLVAPKGSRTRPTADRVKEALFSILFDVEGFAVLDLFAGSGAIGLEALSRGAARSVFVEKDRAALEALEANVEGLALSERAEVRRQPVASALRSLLERGERFDLVFADPPWDRAEELLADVLASAPSLISEAGTLVLEHEQRDSSPLAPEGMIAIDQRRYGDTALSFYQRSR